MHDDGRGTDDNHHAGLAHDLARMDALLRSGLHPDRRRALQLLAGASLIPVIGCGSEEAAGVDAGGSDPDGGSAACSSIPEETGGPYPGDGTNGPNVLTQSGIVRSDIRSSFATLSGAAAGIPLTIDLTLTGASGACAPLAGYAVYLWHCDREGNYSLYTGTATSQNYLRGVQAADANGKVSFISIFPACYSGRWPHVHFEIYQSLEKAMSAGNRLRTSQLALPAAVCDVVFATTGYEQSVRNLAGVTLTSDMVFRDGTSLQLASVTGSTSAGYVATLKVGVG